jgi:MFS family permease
MGWTSPTVLVSLGAGVALLVLFTLIETRVAYPMFRLALFKIRAFTAGTFAAFLAAIGRGGLMFMLIIWLQGIWLPQHGYSFSQTPLWAGIYMLPLTFGFLLAGPASGVLSDRFGARPFATGGMIVAAASFFLLELLPVNFSYILFALLLLLNGLAMGAFASPNRAAVMNSLPARHRGVGSGMSLTFQNSATVLSIGVFFTLMIVGLASTLPASLTHGLAAYHVPARRIHEIAHQPPVSVLFSAFLGFNPVEHLVGAHVIAQIGQVHPASAAALTGRSFFPQLISGPFKHGLSEEEESPPVVVPSVPLQPTTDEGVLVQPDGNGRRARGRTRSKAAELDHVARSSSRTPMKPRRW